MAHDSLAEEALSLVARSGHAPLTEVPQLRATNSCLCKSITGHLPADLTYVLYVKPSRNQVWPPHYVLSKQCEYLLRPGGKTSDCCWTQLKHILELRRLAGPGLARLDCTFSHVPFLHLLPNLMHLSLRNSSHRGRLDSIGTCLDTGSLYALSSLRTLHIEGAGFSVIHLDQLLSLQELCLDDFNPVPKQESTPFCLLPPQLTHLEMTVNGDWCTECVPVLHLVLQQFQGQLRSLTLDPPYMRQYSNNAVDLSATTCLQQLTELRLAFVGALDRTSSQLVLPAPQSLQLHLVDWAFDNLPGEYLKWDLSGCPGLQMLSLLFNDESEVPHNTTVMDLRGVTGCTASSLHLQLSVASSMRAIADFVEWDLRLVTIDTQRINENRDEHWHAVQGVKDFLGALVGHIPMCKVTVDGEQLG